MPGAAGTWFSQLLFPAESRINIRQQPKSLQISGRVRWIVQNPFADGVSYRKNGHASGRSEKNTRITIEGYLVRVNRYRCFFTRVLVIHQEMVISWFFNYFMDLPQITAAFSALTAFKRQVINPPIPVVRYFMYPMLMSLIFKPGIYLKKCNPSFFNPDTVSPGLCPSFHSLTSFPEFAGENGTQVTRGGLNVIPQ